MRRGPCFAPRQRQAHALLLARRPTSACLQVFSRAGDVKRIIMGLDKHRMTPCGFAFVVYYTHADAEDAVKYISGTVLDDRPVRADFDWGFKEGRQFGRGRSGGQACLLGHLSAFSGPQSNLNTGWFQRYCYCFTVNKVGLHETRRAL